jgi:hypothetical protein
MESTTDICQQQAKTEAKKKKKQKVKKIGFQDSIQNFIVVCTFYFWFLIVV